MHNKKRDMLATQILFSSYICLNLRVYHNSKNFLQKKTKKKSVQENLHRGFICPKLVYF